VWATIVCAWPARETACPSRDSCSVQAGSAGRPTPKHACACACPHPPHQARSEFRLCARGRSWVCVRCLLSVPRRSPPPVSRYSWLQYRACILPRTRLWPASKRCLLAAPSPSAALPHSSCSRAATALLQTRAGPPTHHAASSSSSSPLLARINLPAPNHAYRAH
jgi:hypothetical protein